MDEIVATLGAKLSDQLEKSTTLQKSLKEIKSDNLQLQSQKTHLQKTVKTQVETITTLQEHVSSLKKKYDQIVHKNGAEKDAKMLELDGIRNHMKSKDALLKSVEETNQKLSEDLVKNHKELLSTISDEARKILQELSKLLGSSLTSSDQDPVTLLQQANCHLSVLSENTAPLQRTVEKLKANVESQTKSISKLSSEKKTLKVELLEVGKQNKTLQKEKAKLQREIESLKKESIKAKNLSQSFKTRLEELKANIRCIRREKDHVVQEKKSIQSKLKKLGVSHDILRKELKAKKESTKLPRSGTSCSNIRRLLTPEVREELQDLLLKSEDELDNLDASLVRLESYKKETKSKLRDSEAVREYLSTSTSRYGNCRNVHYL